MSHSISGSTQAYLIPGDPVRNVRLPRMFNAAFERFGIDAVLLPMQVPVRDFAVFFKSAFLARNVRGMVIAPPHKPLVVDLLEGCGLFGRVAGSVNVVRRTEGDQLEGDLFDGEGLIGALDHYNIPFRGKRVLILGAGVSAAAIGVALAEGGTVNGAEHIAFFDTVAGKAAGQAAGLVLQVVAAVGLLAAQLAAAGQLEALLSTTVGLHLRHGNRSPYVSADWVCSSFVRPPSRAAGPAAGDVSSADPLRSRQSQVSVSSNVSAAGGVEERG